MQNWLKIHGDAIEVVFANNDDMALGAIDALKRVEIPSADWPVVVGIDGTSVGLEAVLLGELAGTVLNDAAGQAQQLLDLACALVFGTPMPELSDGKYIRLPYRAITLKNVTEYLEKVEKWKPIARSLP
jgi:methyl-galactoside transport system substrate-binding protein